MLQEKTEGFWLDLKRHPRNILGMRHQAWQGANVTDRADATILDKEKNDEIFSIARMLKSQGGRWAIHDILRR